MLGTRAAIATAETLVRIAPVRALMLKLAKPFTSRPTQAQLASGWFRLQLDAQGGGRLVRTEVCGGDPGYGATSVMLGQAALCLLEDRQQLPACSGVVTPAQALGDRLIERLQVHGITFRVLSA